MAKVKLHFLLDLSDPSFVCSPQSTIISVAVVLISLNVVFVAAFVFFYRLYSDVYSVDCMTA